MSHTTSHDGAHEKEMNVSLGASQGMREEERFVRQENGRNFNIISDSYSIPADVDEWDRLNTQHKAFALGMGGLYPEREVVQAILAPQEGVVKRIVDLGCGSGIWAADIAREFPHCEVLGIDLAPVPTPAGGFPPNCRFEMADINQGLLRLHGQYDLVFARAVGLGLKDFKKTLADLQECAKPGGMVVWMDGDYDFYSDWPMMWKPFWSHTTPNGSYMRRMLYEVRRSAALGGSDVETMEKIIDEGFWNNALMLDPDTCKAASLYLPVGTWCQEGDPAQRELLRRVGMLMRQDFTEASRSIQPFLIKSGWSQETIDRWAAGMREECQNGTIGLRMRLAWGRRRESADYPGPTMSGFIPSGNKGLKTTQYPFYEEFSTPEQAAAATTIRNRGKDIPAPPLASVSTE